MAFSTHDDAEAAVVALQAAQAKIVAEAHADTTVVNTTTETDAVSLTLPAGAVAAGDLIRVTVWADLLNNSGGNVSYTFRFKFGTTTVLATAGSFISTNANRLKLPMTFECVVESTTAQRWRGTAVGVRTASTWSDGGAPTYTAVGYGTSAENTSTPKAVKVTVQMATASASADFVAHGATLEIIKKV